MKRKEPNGKKWMLERKNWRWRSRTHKKERKSAQNVNTCNCIIQFQFIIQNCSRELLLWPSRFSSVYLAYSRSTSLCRCPCLTLALVSVCLRLRPYHLCVSFLPFSITLMQISVAPAAYWHIVPFHSMCMFVQWASIHKFVAEHNQISICKTYSPIDDYDDDGGDCDGIESLRRKETKLKINLRKKRFAAATTIATAAAAAVFFCKFGKVSGYYLKFTAARSSSERKEST